jgi:hypothetical protein
LHGAITKGVHLWIKLVYGKELHVIVYFIRQSSVSYYLQVSSNMINTLLNGTGYHVIFYFIKQSSVNYHLQVSSNMICKVHYHMQFLSIYQLYPQMHTLCYCLCVDEKSERGARSIKRRFKSCITMVK